MKYQPQTKIKCRYFQELLLHNLKWFAMFLPHPDETQITSNELKIQIIALFYPHPTLFHFYQCKLLRYFILTLHCSTFISANQCAILSSPYTVPLLSVQVTALFYPHPTLLHFYQCKSLHYFILTLHCSTFMSANHCTIYPHTTVFHFYQYKSLRYFILTLHCSTFISASSISDFAASVLVAPPPPA